MLHKVKILNTKSFDSLVSTSSKIIMEMNPVSTSQMGNPMYNNLWPDISDKGVVKDIEVLKAIQQKLTELEISEENYPEAQLLEWYTEFTLFELEKLRYWQYVPYLSSTILGGIISILQQDFDIDSRIHSIFARLSSVITLIRGEQRRLDKPVKIWIESEIISLNNLITYLTNLPDTLPDLNDEMSNILQDNIDETVDLLTDHRRWLDNLETIEELPTNAETYEKMLEMRKFGLDAESLEKLGRDYLNTTQNQLEQLVKQLDGDTIAEVRQLIREDHASDFDGVVANYKKLAENARDLIQTKDLLTLPEENLEVIFTPEPLRNYLSIAAARSPGRFSEDQTGYFYCTPHDDESMLEEHSYAYQPLLMSHESYPGHHVHGACVNNHPSLIRSSIFTNPSSNTGLMYSSKIAEVIEGWGLYCEKMMYEHGFENDPNNPDLRQKFLQINALRWRATRIVIDVNLHSGRMSFDDAVNYLVENTGYNRKTAESEVLMYSKSPGYFSSYLLGRHLLLQLKDDFGSDEKEFHNKILYAGLVPFWFLKKYEFNIDN